MATIALNRADSPLAQSIRVWVALLGFLAGLNLFITYVGGGLETDPRAALFSWPAIAVFGVLGLVGIFLSHRTGFPAGGPIPAAAIVLGLAIGIVTVLGDLAFGWTSHFAQQHALESFNVPFPGSVPFYIGGAIESEVFFRLLPIPLFLWLISNVVQKGRRQSETFWVLAILTSFIEPVLQDLPGMGPDTMLLSLSAFVPDYALNFSQAAMFRRSGFLAAIALRVVFYLVWHVAYGNFICRC